MTLRSFRNLAVVVARLGGVITVVYLIACGCFGVPIYYFAAGVVLGLLISPLATSEGVPVDDAVAFAVANTLLLPIYGIKQFVLGFPDRETLIPTPPSNPRRTIELSPFIQKVGTVVAALKPCGTVEIDGAVHSAATADGRYLESGTQIRVVATRNSQLVVMAKEWIADGAAK